MDKIGKKELYTSLNCVEKLKLYLFDKNLSHGKIICYRNVNNINSIMALSLISQGVMVRHFGYTTVVWSPFLCSNF